MLIALLFAGLVAVPAGASAAAPNGVASYGIGAQPAVVAEAEADGTVAVTVRYTFDLSDQARADAFAELQHNATAQEAFLTTFQNRMDAVAADTAAATDRNVSAGEASIAVRTADSTGIVELSVPIENLAAAEDGRIVLSEPFASNFDPDREFRVVLPDGYEATATSPDPTATGDGNLSWAAGTSLDGFELVAEGTDTDGSGGTTPGGNSPGFEVVAVLTALAALVAPRLR